MSNQVAQKEEKVKPLFGAAPSEALKARVLDDEDIDAILEDEEEDGGK